MRRKEKQVFDTELLHSVINDATICRIGLVQENHPYVIPLSFGFNGTHIYFHSAKSGEKVEILKINNNVCVEFEQDISIIENDKPCEWSARYFTVVVHGTAELVVNPDEKRYGLDQILRHYKARGDQYIFTDEEIRPVLVYKVIVKEIIGKISGMEV